MSKRRFEGDPLEAVRRIDPIDPLTVPADTTGAHARALFQEVISMNDTETRTSEAPRRQPWMRRVALGAGMAVVVAAVAGGAYALLRDNAEEIVVGGEPIGSGAMTMCIEYTEEMLRDQQFAFDGTLISATENGSEVVFEVHQWFKGGDAAQVTLGAEGLIGPTSIALTGPGLTVGERYLASGSDGFVWACGYSVTYDTGVAAHWAELFGA
ncbi:MAG: hypothetical protein KJ956_09800 [Actinobacteria bacterium]|nr:hypothetical protein [Actinomycetota bacterium]